MCTLFRRPVSDRAPVLQTCFPGLTPLEAQLLAARGMQPVKSSLSALLATPLRDLETGAERLVRAIRKREPLVVIADYDCDGATACAVMVAGLRALGASIDYVVPDRRIHGYGISPSVVDLALERFPAARVLITVDNGILGHAGIDYARSRGLDIVVTDHHLPGDTLPNATAIIDPSRSDCESGLAALAGVGVALWVVVAVKRLLASSVSLNFLLPYVALGTIADVVRLDSANRTLVSVGLERIRLRQAPIGLVALMEEAGVPPDYLTTQDLGFALGPRLNAAGRLESMSDGINLLLTQDSAEAKALAALLTETNNERKRLQKEAVAEASLNIEVTLSPTARSLVLGSADWHPGVVGLVASRLKEELHRPTFIFSLMDETAKGSGRSIPGFHLKDALEEISRRCPGLLSHFGGHAMAAGASLVRHEGIETFATALEMIARERITPAMLEDTVLSDGPIPDLDLALATRLMRHPWGQGFEPPAFDDEVKITDVRPLGKDGAHWKIKAQPSSLREPMTVVLFNQPEPARGEAHVYCQPSLNTWKDVTQVQWLGRILH